MAYHQTCGEGGGWADGGLSRSRLQLDADIETICRLSRVCPTAIAHLQAAPAPLSLISFLVVGFLSKQTPAGSMVFRENKKRMKKTRHSTVHVTELPA